MINMIFRDREEAGEKLAQELKKYRAKKNTVVLALPRGGVVLASRISSLLDLPLDVVVPRKIGAPGNQEYAIGAITEEGSFLFNDQEIENLNVDKKYIISEVKKEKREAQRRVKLYRGGKKKLILKSKEIIIVDDGIATGLTMMAAIKSIKNDKPSKIIVAVPVSARDSLEKIKKMADEIICLYTPLYFGAVGAFYADFEQVTDEEVIKLIKIHN